MDRFRERVIKYDRERFFGKWQLDGTPEQACIGKGSYGSVYAVFHQKSDGTREQAAIKIIPIDEDSPRLNNIVGREARQNELNKMRQDVEREISISEQLKGARNVAYFHDYMIRDLAPGAQEGLKGCDVLIWMHKLVSLKEYFKQIDLKPDTPRYRLEVLRLWRDISIALGDCERKAIIHADVKPDNILFSPEYDCYMLCDFGVAIQRAYLKNEWQGTFPYMSPEMFYQRGGDSRTDMYSLAVTVYEMLNGGLPPLQHVKRDEKKQGDLLRQPVPAVERIPADVNEALLKCL